MTRLLAMLLGLSPQLVLLAGALGGGAAMSGLGTLGFWAWSSFVEGPRVDALVKAAVDRANDQCTIVTLKAAQAAREAERSFQQQVSADALAVYRTALDAQTTARQDAEDKLDQEIANHEAEMAAAGRSDVVTDADFDWLRQKPGAGGTGAGGR